MKNADLPAMPIHDEEHAAGILKGVPIATETMGLTKREHFAAMAMQGILGNAYWNEYGDYKPFDVAGAALEYADALLAELEKTS